MKIRTSKNKITIFSGYMKVSLTYKLKRECFESNVEGEAFHYWEDGFNNIHLCNKADNTKWGTFEFTRQAAIKWLAECFNRKKCPHPIMLAEGTCWLTCTKCGYSKYIHPSSRGTGLVTATKNTVNTENTNNENKEVEKEEVKSEAAETGNDENATKEVVNATPMQEMGTTPATDEVAEKSDAETETAESTIGKDEEE